jgi:secreted pullulanase
MRWISDQSTSHLPQPGIASARVSLRLPFDWIYLLILLAAPTAHADAQQTLPTEPFMQAEDQVTCRENGVVEWRPAEQTHPALKQWESVQPDFRIQDRQGNLLKIKAIEDQGNHLEIHLESQRPEWPLAWRTKGRWNPIRVNWKLTDQLFSYDGPLGPELMPDGSAACRLWSPYAWEVKLRLYSPENAQQPIADLPMIRAHHGTWQISLNPHTFGLDSLRGAFYEYLIRHEPDAAWVSALDPYAPSMALHHHPSTDTPKAAIVSLQENGGRPAPARIPNYRGAQDAIIWEAHIRDLSSDPAIEQDLNAPFGTFDAACSRLDYIRKLGITHLQLLPVMSCLLSSDLASRDREWQDVAQNCQYNWGYDPLGYFSLSGRFSVDPADPERRIHEFKNLVKAAHERGLGVILDVVFNHTASLELFENLVPGYYHFSDADGTPRTSFGGGRLASTRAMVRRLMRDALCHWTQEFGVDGFRFDMMGDHDAESVRLVCEAARRINPELLIIGEGWRTYVGDEGDPRQAADQDWVGQSQVAAVFSDEFRNEIKSGYGNEGEPRLVTAGPRNIQRIFRNLKAQPDNFHADQPTDVVTYVAAHDNLTLHDVIACAIGKDPDLPENQHEIQKRIRLANSLVLLSQGIAFLHAGQEYGRTKQWRSEGQPEQKGTLLTVKNGPAPRHPWFVHDSFDASDRINHFNWAKATDPDQYPLQEATRRYTEGMIALRRSTDAFRIPTRDEVESRVRLLDCPDVADEDLAFAFQATASDQTTYYVFFNADTQPRPFRVHADLSQTTIIVDEDEAGPNPVQHPSGFRIEVGCVTLAPLSLMVCKTSSPQND